MSDHRPSIYYDETIEKWVYRVSALGHCIGNLVAFRMGEEGSEHPDWLLERFQEGTDWESKILAKFTDLEAQAKEWGQWRLLDVDDPKSYHSGEKAGSVSFPYSRVEMAHDDQFTIEIPVGENVVIRGHMDGIGQLVGMKLNAEIVCTGWELGQRVVMEAKFFGPDYWKKWTQSEFSDFRTAFPDYAWQISLYMVATGLPCIFIVAEKEQEERDGKRVTVGIKSIDYRVFTEPPVPMGLIKAKVARIERMASEGQLPPCDQRMYPCQMYWLTACDKRDAKDVELPEGLSEVERTELRDLGLRYLKGSDWEKQGKAIKTEAKDGIVKLFDKGGIKGKAVTVDGVRVEDYVEQVPASVRETKAYEKRYPKVKTEFNEKSEKEDE